jgi:hypothetical protein
LPSSFVIRSLQIVADMRLTHVSLEDKIPAAFRDTYFVATPSEEV